MRLSAPFFLYQDCLFLLFCRKLVRKFDKIARAFCKTIGTTPIGIAIKHPTEIIAAKRATKDNFKTFLFFMIKVINFSNYIVNRLKIISLQSIIILAKLTHPSGLPQLGNPRLLPPLRSGRELPPYRSGLLHAWSQNHWKFSQKTSGKGTVFV